MTPLLNCLSAPSAQKIITTVTSYHTPQIQNKNCSSTALTISPNLYAVKIQKKKKTAHVQKQKKNSQSNRKRCVSETEAKPYSDCLILIKQELRRNLSLSTTSPPSQQNISFLEPNTPDYFTQFIIKNRKHLYHLLDLSFSRLILNYRWWYLCNVLYWSLFMVI